MFLINQKEKEVILNINYIIWYIKQNKNEKITKSDFLLEISREY
jgi:hypothetical protein